MTKNTAKSKKTYLVITILLCSLMRSSFGESMIEDPKKIKVVYIGTSGFAGGQSKAGEIYKNIAKQKDADNIFIETIKSNEATMESKIYAACGLLKTSKQLFLKNKGKTFENDKQVSVLRGDVLRKEKASELIKNFENFGCNLDLE